MSSLMSAIEGISDAHIQEFAFVHIPKRTIPVWSKVASLAASLVVILLAITVFVGKKFSIVSTNSKSGSEYASSELSSPQTNSSEDKSENNSNGNSDIPTNALPLVIFNDAVYVIAGDDYPTYDLPKGYVFVGEVTSNNKTDRNASGYSSGCHVGDKIYQNPSDPQDVFVSTTLFSGSDKYWYIRFVKSTHRRLKE